MCYLIRQGARFGLALLVVAWSGLVESQELPPAPPQALDGDAPADRDAPAEAELPIVPDPGSTREVLRVPPPRPEPPQENLVNRPADVAPDDRPEDQPLSRPNDRPAMNDAPPPPEEHVETLTGRDQRELARFLLEYRRTMSVHPLLQADVIEDYKILRVGDGRRLEIALRASHRDSPLVAERLMADRIGNDPYWKTADDPIEVVLVVPNAAEPGRPDRLRYWLQTGRLAFRQGDFDAARTSFQSALLETPAELTRITINFRAALCDLALGRHDLVRERLDWLLKLDPRGSSSPDVAVALEEVQGPLRIALGQMERATLLEQVRRGEVGERMPTDPNETPPTPMAADDERFVSPPPPSPLPERETSPAPAADRDDGRRDRPPPRPTPPSSRDVPPAPPAAREP